MRDETHRQAFAYGVRCPDGHGRSGSPVADPANAAIFRRVQSLALVLAVGYFVVAFAAGAAFLLLTQHRLPPVTFDPMADGRDRLARRDVRGAVAEYHTAVAIHPSGSYGLLPPFNRAQRSGPDAVYARAHVGDLPSYRQLGEDLLLYGRQDEAAAFLYVLIQEPENASMHAGMGDAWADAGRPDVAVCAYRRSLGADPGQAGTRSLLHSLRFYSVRLVLGYALFQVWPWAYVAAGFGFAESALLVAAMINVHHLIVDAYIWRLREGRNQRIVLVQPAAA